MEYLEDFSADDAAFGVLGGFLLCLAVVLTSWHPNVSLATVFHSSSVWVFFIGFVLGSVVSSGWRDGLRFLLPLAVVPLLAGFILYRCRGTCYYTYSYFYWISLALVFTSYLGVVLHRNREIVTEFLKGKEGEIDTDIGWSLGTGITYFAVFLVLNTVVRWPAVLDSPGSAVTYILFSLGMIPAASISVWLYIRENLKSPLLIHLPWIALWNISVLGKAEQIPLGEFYMHSYILPTIDYTFTWPMLLSLILISAVTETRFRQRAESGGVFPSGKLMDFIR